MYLIKDLMEFGFEGVQVLGQGVHVFGQGAPVSGQVVLLFPTIGSYQNSVYCLLQCRDQCCYKAYTSYAKVTLEQQMSVHFQSVSHQNPSDLRYQVYLISDLSSIIHFKVVENFLPQPFPP